MEGCTCDVETFLACFYGPEFGAVGCVCFFGGFLLGGSPVGLGSLLCRVGGFSDRSGDHLLFGVREGHMIEIKCRLCGKVLDEPGGLAFSPPSFPFDMVDKFHICKTCWWEKFRPALLGQRILLERPPTEVELETAFKTPSPEEVSEALENVEKILGPPGAKSWDQIKEERGDPTETLEYAQERLVVAQQRDKDAFPHTHGDHAPWAERGQGQISSARRWVQHEHTHAWSSTPHNHILREICLRPECEEFETHNIHEGGDVKTFLDGVIDAVRIRGDGKVLFDYSWGDPDDV